MRAILRFSLLLGVVILGTMTPQAQDIDLFENLNFITCPYNTPASHETECGFFAVPETHADPDSRNIQIAFAIVRTNHPDPEPDPVVYLVGGPGGSMLGRMAWVWNDQFAPFAARRDVIFVDQRGTGFAQPRLYCDEIVEHYAQWVGGFLDPEENKAFVLDILQACHDRLTESGINLAAYNSAESAADFEALRRALGYEEWNLYGVSYGTRLALTIMRDYPDGVRSVILDSVLPLQADLYTELPDNIARVLDVLFDGCANDNACSTTYPYFHDVFWKLVSDLNREPLQLTVSRPDVGQINLIIDGNRVINWVFNWSYAVPDIERIPAYVHALASGDREQMTQPILDGLDSESSTLFIDVGMHYSVQCGEEVAYLPANGFDDLSERHPRLADYVNASFELGDDLFMLCENWSRPPLNPAENAPVVSDIPALVLAGEYDPITPPRWAQQAAETLSNHVYYEASGIGHGVIRSSDCFMSLAVAFIDAPGELSSSCAGAANPPDFMTTP